MLLWDRLMLMSVFRLSSLKVNGNADEDEGRAMIDHDGPN
jgi:hypothetical protein